MAVVMDICQLLKMQGSMLAILFGVSLNMDRICSLMARAHYADNSFVSPLHVHKIADSNIAHCTMLAHLFQIFDLLKLIRKVGRFFWIVSTG